MPAKVAGGSFVATEEIETVIIGGGQSGLAMSHCFNQLGLEHVILERDRIAERWRSQRWDSLTFQFPNWMMQLPGFPYDRTDLERFAHRDEVVGFIERYAASFRAPVREGIAVTSLDHNVDKKRFEIRTGSALISAANVVIATGPYQDPAVPTGLDSAMRGVFQIHSSLYRNPDELPPGAVLIVGSGSSGCQIAEDMLRAGRRTYLAVGSHRRVPRRYRDRDFAYWEFALGEFDRTLDRRPAERMSPLLTGVDGGHDVDLRSMARRGLVLLGRLIGGEDGKLALAPDLAATLARGDQWFEAFIAAADRYATENGLDLPRDDLEGIYLAEPNEVSEPLRELDLAVAGVSSVIWATGFTYDFGWVRLPVFAQKDGSKNRGPIQQRGVTSFPGLYFLGLPWLHKRKSSLMAGVGEDAAFLAEHIVECRKS
jgi:putative flavoprotein involved in K+ transport